MFWLFVNRVVDKNHAKLDVHYDFSLQLPGKNLIVVGEHIGSSSQSGHWRRHELVGSQWLTISDKIVTLCSDVSANQASFLIYS